MKRVESKYPKFRSYIRYLQIVPEEICGFWKARDYCKELMAVQ